MLIAIQNQILTQNVVGKKKAEKSCEKQIILVNNNDTVVKELLSIVKNQCKEKNDCCEFNLNENIHCCESVCEKFTKDYKVELCQPVQQYECPAPINIQSEKFPQCYETESCNFIPGSCATIKCEPICPINNINCDTGFKCAPSTEPCYQNFQPQSSSEPCLQQCQTPSCPSTQSTSGCIETTTNGTNNCSNNCDAESYIENYNEDSGDQSNCSYTNQTDSSLGVNIHLDCNDCCDSNSTNICESGQSCKPCQPPILVIPIDSNNPIVNCGNQSGLPSNIVIQQVSDNICQV